ncbi:MAG: hypothetical protein KGJ80_06055 [Chloroflexota bacterium]|nr:hypothetical protein [Chloroflexota bacterium]
MKRAAILGLLLVALALSACGGGAATAVPTQALPPTAATTPTKAATATPIPTATATAAPTSANPLDALTRIFRGWTGVKSFRAKITTTTSAGATTETTLDVVMPDRFHIVSKQFEAIVIGATYYVKTGTTWQKIALPKGLDFSFADLKKIEAELGASTDIRLVGPEVLDGTPTLVYQYTTTIKTPTPLTTTSKVWVAVSDQLPRKMESLSKTGTKTTAIYFDYNAAITIEPPIK